MRMTYSYSYQLRLGLGLLGEPAFCRVGGPQIRPGRLAWAAEKCGEDRDVSLALLII
jgi:hypothetical protein